VKKFLQSDKYFKRLLVVHKHSHIERSMRIIQKSYYFKK